MCDAIVEHPIVDVLSATALALTFKKARLVIIPTRASRADYKFLPQQTIYHVCAADFAGARHSACRTDDSKMILIQCLLNTDNFGSVAIKSISA